VGHFCSPGFEYGSTDLIESGSNPDPDLRHWYIRIKDFKKEVDNKQSVHRRAGYENTFNPKKNVLFEE
jgi:hypothetical protein